MTFIWALNLRKMILVKINSFFICFLLPFFSIIFLVFFIFCNRILNIQYCNRILITQYPQHEEIINEIGLVPFNKLKKINLLHMQFGQLYLTNQHLIDLNCRLLKHNKRCELYIEITGEIPKFPTKQAKKRARHLICKIATRINHGFCKRYRIRET